MVKTTRPADAASRLRPSKPTTSMSSITRKGSTRTSTNSSSTVTKKKNSDHNTQCFDVASDMSADECDKTPTKSNGGQRTSIVHDFATKTSPNEYICNICTKVS